MREKLEQLKTMMEPEYDWKTHYETDDTSAQDIFREYFKTVGLHDDEPKLSGYEVQGFKIADTPRGLYRALFLGRPKSVDFSDMYKTGMLFAVVSPCGNFFATIELYKYELGVYAYCTKQTDVGGESSWVKCGIPGIDNGLHCINPDGILWFAVLKMALEFEHDVYSGNGFKV